jgi:hypothetical protein
LEGIKGIKGGQNIEIYPYAGYRASRSGDETDNKFAYGLDLKYGITSNLTLDFTSSPDYSEVESDPFFYQVLPYEVNLQENRPFYNESSSYFETPYQLFYSRRITDPDLAVKVTGKEKGFSLGALFAKNRREGVPDAYHGVFRLKKDIFKLSHIGLIYSSIEEKGNYNRNVGVDFNFIFKDIYSLNGMAAFSYNKDVPNSNNGMYEVLFKRRVDNGFSFSARYQRVEPDVYVPAGYLSRVDYQNGLFRCNYSFRWEGNWLERMIIYAYYYYEAGVENDLKTEDNAFLSWEGLTRSRIYFGFDYRFGRTRGQVLNEDGELVWDHTMYPLRSYLVILSYSGSPVVEPGVSLSVSDRYVYNSDYTATTEGTTTEFGLWSNFKISPQLQLNISYNKTHYKSDDGTIRFKGDLISSRINYQISKRLSTFLKFQYDSYLERFQYDFIIGYEPANVSKIVFSIKNYSEHRFRLFDPDARSLAFKVSYLYRF